MQRCRFSGMPAFGVSVDLFSGLSHHPFTAGRHTPHSTVFTEDSSAAQHSATENGAAANDSATETCEHSVCACKEGYHCIHKDESTGHYFFACKVEEGKPDRIDGYDKVISECNEGKCLCVRKTIEMSVNGSKATIEPSYELREFPAKEAEGHEHGHEHDKIVPTNKLYRRTEWLEHYKKNKGEFQTILDDMHTKIKKSVEAAEGKGHEAGGVSEEEGAERQADKVDGHAEGSNASSASSGNHGATEQDAGSSDSSAPTAKKEGESSEIDGDAQTKDVAEKNLAEKSSDEAAAGGQSDGGDEENADANDDGPNQDEAKQLEGLALLGSTLLNQFGMMQKTCVHMQDIAQKLCTEEDNCGDSLNCYEDATEQAVTDKFAQLIIVSENMASQNISSFLQVFPSQELHHNYNFTHRGRCRAHSFTHNGSHATDFGIMSIMTGGDATLKQRGWSGLKGGLMAGAGAGAVCKLRGGNQCLGNAAKSAAVGGVTSAVTNNTLAGGAVGVGFGALTHKGMELPLLALQPHSTKRHSAANRMTTFRNFLVAT
eukprot:TRINITY_DN2486_c0_g1_i2.p1 TRINITY_DN2486_c0_g1~~TRINITY_DN2486_c0_g1_i2.p1  ORF type:complete len:544 (+),score=96.49 TRINITY_DN2486_c0_g1_i2:135-1766(+)